MLFETEKRQISKAFDQCRLLFEKWHLDVGTVQIKEAIVIRFGELCAQKKIKYNELATLSGVTPSTVYSMMDPRRKDLSVITMKKLCDGLEISISQFFNTDIFRHIEQEIR